MSPAFASAFSVAGTGPRPMISGASAAEADATMRARGVSPCRSIAADPATTIAEAPSLSEEELPAVTTPPPATTGRSPARTSSVVSRRGPSSVSTSPPRGVGTATISGARRPASIAAMARSWLRSAKASASSRVMPSRRATSSAVSGIEKVALSRAARRGFVNRQPIEVSNASPGFAQARSGFACTQGARVIDSTPPAIIASASPARIACAASATADIPEAHSRLTVRAGSVSGRPASSTAMRAMLRLSSPA